MAIASGQAGDDKQSKAGDDIPSSLFELKPHCCGRYCCGCFNVPVPRLRVAKSALGGHGLA